MLKFCPILSGSSGNLTLLEYNGARLLIDAGVPGRTAEALLSQLNVPASTISAILVTHEHRDHVAGVGVLSRRFDIPVYANAATWEGMEPIVGAVPPRDVRVFETGRDFYIKDINITAVRTSHDAAESVGFVFMCGGAKAALLTDMGYMSESLLCAAEHSDVLLLESNHDVDMLLHGRYPYPLKQRILGEYGHLSNDACGEALSELYFRGVKSAILGHLSHDNNTEETAYAAVRNALRAQDIPDEEFALSVAHRDRCCGVFEV